ncbi:NAD(P)-binding protein [Cylindrobasidium torrendii FP15055 ss-10]|uniref:NAD(P)-binding protein n=1 Tax=Cylindrobasidium torrendii FP15055 ss-10 TaxID=1314674 RepID=A0A0D7BFS5_9AGAR|nr:NAD(P)-binding protein [Cylindrobasidium torrendii FP15055 ss-10]
MSISRRLFIVAGLGIGSGTGASAARLFAKSGYTVALLSRARNGSSETLNSLAEEINQAGGQAGAFSVESYDSGCIMSAFKDIHAAYPPGQYPLRAALWNAGQFLMKPFLETTDDELASLLDTNVRAPFAFSREAILRFKKNQQLDEQTGGNGTLIFTGATASMRGSKMTSAFSPAKSGLRALSQSLAKEFGPSNGIHVAHAVIDGRIIAGRASNVDEEPGLLPDSIAQSYLALTKQHKSAWTWELDLRPAEEQW